MLYTFTLNIQLPLLGKSANSCFNSVDVSYNLLIISCFIRYILYSLERKHKQKICNRNITAKISLTAIKAMEPEINKKNYGSVTATLKTLQKSLLCVLDTMQYVNMTIALFYIIMSLRLRSNSSLHRLSITLYIVYITCIL